MDGSDILNFYGLLAGVSGLFTGSGNAAPAQYSALWDLARQGEFAEAKAVWDRIVPLVGALWTLPLLPAGKAASEMTAAPPADRVPV